MQILMNKFVLFFIFLNSNISFKVKEIGLLMVLGVTKFGIYRIYIYEAFVILCSSSLLGVGIGVIMGWSQIIQQTLWTGVPIPFVLPWELLLLITAISLVCAIVAASRPLYSLMKKPLVDLLLKM
jgi:ABC-type antimicrobial peptide transport system permease subunit